MNNIKKIVAFIPARSGSKGIPNKNIQLYKDEPLIVHSIKLAKKNDYIHEVYVSTDSPQYKEIAIKYGANVPFLRPKEISDDLSPDIDCFKHFLEWYFKEYHFYPDILIHLRPTYPNRTTKLLNDCILTFIDNYNEYDSLRTVIPIDKTPVKMYFIEDKKLIPYFPNFNAIVEPYNQARQLFAQSYLHNGCIDIIKTSTIINDNLLSGKNIYPYIMDKDEDCDIDTEADLIHSQNKIINL